MRKLTTQGRGYFFWGGVIVTVLMIAFFAAGAWIWGIVALVVAIAEFGMVAARMRQEEP